MSAGLPMRATPPPFDFEVHLMPAEIRAGQDLLTVFQVSFQASLLKQRIDRRCGGPLKARGDGRRLCVGHAALKVEGLTFEIHVEGISLA